MAPSAEAFVLENGSDREVRFERLSFGAGEGWSLVDDAEASGLPNAVSLSLTLHPGATSAGAPDATATLEDGNVKVGTSPDGSQALWTMGFDADTHDTYGWKGVSNVEPANISLGGEGGPTYSYGAVGNIGAAVTKTAD